MKQRLVLTMVLAMSVSMGWAQTTSKVDLKQHDQDRLLGQDRDSNRSGQIKRQDGIVAKATGAEARVVVGELVNSERAMI